MFINFLFQVLSAAKNELKLQQDLQRKQQEELLHQQQQKQREYSDLMKKKQHEIEKIKMEKESELERFKSEKSKAESSSILEDKMSLVNFFLFD